MGYDRQIQRPALDRSQVIDIVARFIGEETIAQIARESDPFHIDDPCPMNAGAPHRPIASCGEYVCWHCAKIFWK